MNGLTETPGNAPHGSSPDAAHVIERLRFYIATSPLAGLASGARFPTSPVPEDADLVDAGYVDSMGLLDMVSFLESEFGVRVENQELRHDNLSTLSACASFVLRKLKLAKEGSLG